MKVDVLPLGAVTAVSLEPEEGLSIEPTEICVGEETEITVTGRADDTKDYKVTVRAGAKTAEFTVPKKAAPTPPVQPTDGGGGGGCNSGLAALALIAPVLFALRRRR